MDHDYNHQNNDGQNNDGQNTNNKTGRIQNRSGRSLDRPKKPEPIANNAQPSRNSQPDSKARAVGQARTTEDWELIRRSVAMLPTGSWALKREQALEALSSLTTSMRNETERSDQQTT